MRPEINSPKIRNKQTLKI
ncbi:unnamed protein product, partial [Brachionus calyciflorus]